ncbi:MAG TPA: hypothetical protein VHP33_10540 [Polyangiaceae bacterium]|nr:hypothetical protein [Polyangiaceae bacterium]
MLALLALTALGACGGRSTGGGGTTGSVAASQRGTLTGEAEWPDAEALSTPDIPPFPDLCSELKIQLAPPADASQHFTCPCAGNVNLYLCNASSCASSVDCDAACNALADPTRPSAIDCVGYCTSDDDCGGSHCVWIPGALMGTCDSEWCVNDHDCEAGVSCVAVRPDGVRRCASRPSDW